jgi:EAL domain-containing protein (putative c-di-GMP-specific phosphodiesterase class I)
LLDLGCTQMQGYLFSPAVPVADIRPMLTGEARPALATA